MTVGSLLVVALDAGWWSIFGDSRQLGAATLIAIAAVVFGVIVQRFWPRPMQPVLFGWLAALGFVAVLAYAGVASAGVVLWLFIAMSVLLGILALVFN